MKDKVLLIVALFITSSCATTNVSSKKNSLLNADEVIPLAQASYMTNLFTTFSKDAFYYLSSGGVLLLMTIMEQI